VPGARRRPFSNADKRRIPEAADRCTQPGAIGALMHREGACPPNRSAWRRRREAVDLAALAPHKRGPKAGPNRARAQPISPAAHQPISPSAQ